MAAVMCSVKGCKNWAKENGYCAAHSKQYAKKLVGDEGAKKPVMVEKVSKVIKNDKDAYYGGGANQPHVHVYPGGAHLKLGQHRYNLVQNGVRYSSADAAYEALDDHPLGDELRPWVDAALAYFG
jgi:hypothetical protein